MYSNVNYSMFDAAAHRSQSGHGSLITNSTAARQAAGSREGSLLQVPRRGRVLDSANAAQAAE